VFGGWKRPWIAAVLLAAAMLQATAGWGVEARKLKKKVEPDYPELARRMHVAGTVKMEFVISTDGKVKNIRALGGHPLLIQAATTALEHWRYEPGPEKKTVVEFHFTR
jgi:TonB family protein